LPGETEENTETSVGMADLWTEISTQDLVNKKQEYLTTHQRRSVKGERKEERNKSEKLNKGK
jgi:hypothetical protein